MVANMPLQLGWPDLAPLHVFGDGANVNQLSLFSEAEADIAVLFEHSGEISHRLKRMGHRVISCDLKPSAIGAPYHIQGDAIDVILRHRPFKLLIMHPPCTALAVSGNRWYGRGMAKHAQRLAAIDWTLALWDLAKESAEMVAMENPVGVLPIKASQYVQPWQFGHGETKKTGWWLHNLPLLKPTNIVDGREQRIHRLPPSADRAEIRSKTFSGMA